MPAKELFDNLRKKVANAKIKEVIEELLNYAKEEDCSEHNDLLALSSSYSDLERMELGTRISYENYQTHSSKLRRSLIEYIDVFESRADDIKQTITIKEVSTIFKASIGRTKVLEVLLQTEEGLTIKEIHEKSELPNRKFIISALKELIEVGIVERYREKNQSLNQLVEEKREVVKNWF